MPDYDLIIRNGTVVDGTGGIPAFRGDVAVKNGKISMISGRIRASATKELDATGCVVAPGAVDLHNHYDLQLNWEPYATMSGWHGVTSIVHRPVRLRLRALQATGPGVRHAPADQDRGDPAGDDATGASMGLGNIFPNGWTAWPHTHWVST